MVLSQGEWSLCHLFLLAVTSVRVSDHSVTHIYFNRQDSNTQHCYVLSSVSSWQLRHIWQIVTDLRFVFTTAVFPSGTVGGAKSHNMPISTWCCFNKHSYTQITSLLLVIFLLSATEQVNLSLLLCNIIIIIILGLYIPVLHHNKWWEAKCVWFEKELFHTVLYTIGLVEW